MSRRRRHLADDDDVPRLPRGRGITVTGPQLVKIAMTAALLIAMIVLQKPCADATGKFVAGFDTPDAAPSQKAITPPDQLEVPGSSGVYVDLSGKTDEEAIAAIEAARAEAAAAAGGSGSGSGSGLGSGSGTGSGSSKGSGKGSGSKGGSAAGSGSGSGSGR